MADAGRKAACDRVSREFPELAGASPRVDSRGSIRVFTFTRQVPTAAAGPNLRQTVRVTVDGENRVVKVVVSR